MIIYIYFFSFIREETEIIEGEVVEIQIDRPATGTVRTNLPYIQQKTNNLLQYCCQSRYFNLG